MITDSGAQSQQIRSDAADLIDQVQSTNQQAVAAMSSEKQKLVSDRDEKIEQIEKKRLDEDTQLELNNKARMNELKIQGKKPTQNQSLTLF